ncbi:hypothetical protein QE152_g14279 [Popillia japonica]|uniref:Uncharacterized protein n=1 Tax=Popillia japonica TaxID=7064 RepID=A0AAW1L941_POPJA
MTLHFPLLRDTLCVRNDTAIFHPPLLLTHPTWIIVAFKDIINNETMLVNFTATLLPAIFASTGWVPSTLTVSSSYHLYASVRRRRRDGNSPGETLLIAVGAQVC